MKGDLTYKRDVTPMPNYYNAWDKFDVVSLQTSLNLTFHRIKPLSKLNRKRLKPNLQNLSNPRLRKNG